jgi:hypothetical protein
MMRIDPSRYAEPEEDEAGRGAHKLAIEKRRLTSVM